jgi:hypothetical protein
LGNSRLAACTRVSQSVIISTASTVVMGAVCRISGTSQIIQAGRQVITAAAPLPDDLRQALDAVNGTG